MSRYCYTLIAPPEVEEKLLDELLLDFSQTTFTSTETFTHGAASHEMQPDEQVLGRRRAVQVQVLTDANDARRLRQMLADKFGQAGVFSWIVPVIDAGELR